MNAPTLRVVAIVALAHCAITSAQDKTTTTYFEQDVKESNSLRSKQAEELDGYIDELRKDKSRLQRLLPDNYSSPQDFEKSAERYRQAFCDSIGYSHAPSSACRRAHLRSRKGADPKPLC
jgi:hypothetical protein